MCPLQKAQGMLGSFAPRVNAGWSRLRFGGWRFILKGFFKNNNKKVQGLERDAHRGMAVTSTHGLLPGKSFWDHDLRLVEEGRAETSPSAKGRNCSFPGDVPGVGEWAPGPWKVGSWVLSGCRVGRLCEWEKQVS